MSILVFEHEEGCGPGRLGRLLVQYGHRLAIRRLWAGEIPPADLDDVEAVICLSAAAETAELLKAEWARSEAGLIKAAHGRDLPVIGVGTGSLLVALALGGAVGPLGDGTRVIGWSEAKLSFPGTVDAILSGQPWRSMQFVWQSEQVMKVPAGGAGLAGTKECRTLIWRAGVRTYGFGQQLEAEAGDVERWSESRSRQRQAAGLSHEQLMATTRQHMPSFARLSERVCRSVADYLLPSPLRRCS